MSSATVETRPRQQNPVGWLWRHFREFRRTRPFWGGLLAMIAGVPILYFPYAHLSFGGLTIAMSTTAGAGSMIIGVLMIILGLTAWFQPAVRVFAGIATILLTLVSIPVSNLAGFGLALLPGLIGGGLMVSWAPVPEAEPAAKAGRRHRAEDAGGVAAGNTVAQSVAAGPAAGPAGAVAAGSAEAPTAELPAQGGPQAAGPAATGGTSEATEAAGAAVPKQPGAVDQEEAR
ncbi:DUF6114 domain-containing protein [Streptomyces sp. CBMA156]|uniref:DUF6114 domain-containing protein n=1 Tax=Streptomyces sp. CBMA156 TaxID=1930280 RepID=UPI001662162C|nr:DUF6114 domain-containing protein [Streptomyces sp. CBMA156]MBD0670287.1 hypothetical protein [Streptomyces sp. CBMA156]